MSKKKKKEKETTIENYYDLRTKEMDELVAALKGEKTESEEPISYNIEECIGKEAAEQGEETTYKKKKDKEFDPYKIDKFSRIPAWIKALFVKFWFAGAACYFIIFGLGRVFSDALDLAVITGAVIGLFTDLFVNPILRYMESSEKQYDNYMMFPFPFKKFWTFFTNLIYYAFVGFVVFWIYSGINQLFVLINHQYEGYVTVTVEPLLYGIIFLIADMAFIGIKDLIVYLVKRGKRKKEETADV